MSDEFDKDELEEEEVDLTAALPDDEEVEGEEVELHKPSVVLDPEEDHESLDALADEEEEEDLEEFTRDDWEE